MRKIIPFILTIAAVLSVVVSSIQPVHNEYTTTAQVLAINDSENSVSLLDGNGNVWKISGHNELVLGDVCALVLNDCGTKQIEDDVITSFRVYER